MPKALFALFVAAIVLSCTKEESNFTQVLQETKTDTTHLQTDTTNIQADTNNILSATFEESNIVVLNDTVYASYFDSNVSGQVSYMLDINGDNVNDLKISAGESYGSSGYDSYCYLMGLNNSELSMEEIERTTWIYSDFVEGYTDTVWEQADYLQPYNYQLGDTIINENNFSGAILIISKNSYSTSGDSPFVYSDNHRIRNLVGKQFYIGLQINDSLSWINLEVIGDTKLVVKEYLKPIDQESLIIINENAL